MSFLAQATHSNYNTAPSKNTASADIMIPRIMVAFSAAALVLLGLLMVFSAGSVTGINKFGDPAHYAKLQAVFAAIGLVACFVLMKVDYHVWWGMPLAAVFVACVVLLVLVIPLGSSEYGATRWIRFGSVGIQPSEFAKIVLVAFTCKFICLYQQRQIDGLKCFGGVFGTALLPLAFILFTEKDMGSCLICVIGIMAVLWVAEMPLRTIVFSVAALGIAFVLSVLVEPYRLARIKGALFGSEEDSSGVNYQVENALNGFAQGGLFGTGFGAGTQKYGYVPEPQTDFIFSVVGEEMGLLGSLLFIGLFLILLIGGLRVAMHAPDLHGRCLAAGLVTLLIFQSFLNIACVIGIAPVTGKPLPFVSYGGSSLISSLMMIGVILSVSAHSDVHQMRRDDLRLVQSDEGYSRHRRRETERRGGFDAPRGYRAQRHERAGASQMPERTGAFRRYERTGASQLHLVTSNYAGYGRRG